MRVPDEQGNHGRYDDVCERVIKELKANAVLLIVIGGEKGGGFSVATVDERITAFLPALLEDVAQSIREQHEAARNS